MGPDLQFTQQLLPSLNLTALGFTPTLMAMSEAPEWA